MLNRPRWYLYIGLYQHFKLTDGRRIKLKEAAQHRRSTLNLWGRHHISLTWMQRPIRVAMLQWGIVGVNSTVTRLPESFTCNTIKHIQLVREIQNVFYYRKKLTMEVKLQWLRFIECKVTEDVFYLFETSRSNQNDNDSNANWDHPRAKCQLK